MKILARALKWLFTAVLFLLLFAFSLNNQSQVQVHFIFGYSHTLPLILIVLFALGLGVVLGVVGMMPYWLRLQRRPTENLKPEMNSRSVPGKTSAVAHSRDTSNAPITEYGP